MSTVKDKKLACGYNPKPIPSTCVNCAALVSQRALPKWCVNENKIADRDIYTVEVNGIEKEFRCGTHGFAVKKMATCRMFKPKIKS